MKETAASPRAIRRNIEEQRLDELARSEGYESHHSMIYDLYVYHNVAFYELARRLSVTPWRIQVKVRELEVPMRSAGGPNNVSKSFTLTPEIIQEVAKDGISTVAARLGVHTAAVKARVDKWIEIERAKQR